MRKLPIITLLCVLVPSAAMNSFATVEKVPIWLFHLFMEQKSAIIGNFNKHAGKLIGAGAVDRKLAEQIPGRILQDAIRPTTLRVYDALNHAEQPVLQEISKAQGITKEEIQNMIRTELEKQTSSTKPEIDFFSGKIILNKSYDLGALKFKFGEIDFGKPVYTYMSVAAVSIIACGNPSQPNYNECVTTAYREFVSNVTKAVNSEMEFALEDNLNKLDKPATPEGDQKPAVAPNMTEPKQ